MLSLYDCPGCLICQFIPLCCTHLTNDRQITSGWLDIDFSFVGRELDLCDISLVASDLCQHGSGPIRRQLWSVSCLVGSSHTLLVLCSCATAHSCNKCPCFTNNLTCVHIALFWFQIAHCPLYLSFWSLRLKKECSRYWLYNIFFIYILKTQGTCLKSVMNALDLLLYWTCTVQIRTSTNNVKLANACIICNCCLLSHQKWKHVIWLWWFLCFAFSRMDGCILFLYIGVKKMKKHLLVVTYFGLSSQPYRNGAPP